jgi:hypothetical protein
LAFLLSLDREDVEELAATYRAVQDQLPAGVVPFGADGGGDYFCFDFRKSNAFPEVVYWSHELPISEGLQPVARTFTDLLNRLE